MSSRVSFRWLLTLFALIAPAALGPIRPAKEPDAASAAQASSDVVFRHYL